MCKYLDNEFSNVQHYVSSGDLISLIEPSEPQIGLSNSRVEQFENNLTCTFTRENKLTDVKSYFGLEPSAKFYLVVAYGPITTDRKC